MRNLIREFHNNRLLFRLRSYFINCDSCFTGFSKHLRTIELTRLFTARFSLLFSRVCKTLKTIKTIIAFRVLQTLENNKNRLVNSLVNSIILACLETPVKHSHSFMKYYVTNGL